MHKRIAAAAMAFVMVLTMVVAALPVFAAEPVTITVTPDKTTAKVGETVNFTVAMSAVQNLSCARVMVDFPTGGNWNMVKGSAKANTNAEAMNAASVEVTENATNIVFLMGDGHYTSEGTTSLMSFSATVAEGAKGEIQLAIIMEEDDFFDDTLDMNNIPFVVNNGAVTVEAAVEPTVAPTVAPTVEPTVAPTVAPTVEPTVKPTVAPTVKPTVEPTVAPTVKPTVAPTVAPTVKPTAAPTDKPATPEVKEELDKVIEEANGKKQEEYTEESWAAFEAARANAEKVAADKNATEAEVLAAKNALAAAQKNLVAKGDVKPTSKPTAKPEVKPGNDNNKPDANKPAPTAKPAQIPQTGDSSNVALWSGLAILALIGTAGAVYYKKSAK